MSEWWYAKGVRQSEGRDLEGALQSFSKSIAANPANTEAWCGRGDTLVSLERLEEAARTYAGGLSWDPDDTSLLIASAEVLGDLEFHEKSMEFYEKAIALLDGLSGCEGVSETLQGCRATALGNSAKIEAAVQQREAALANDPADRELWALHGQALFDGWRIEDAIKSFQRAIELHKSTDGRIGESPPHLQTKQQDIAGDWVRLGRALGAGGDIHGAVSSFERAAAIDFANGQVFKQQFLMARQLNEAGMHAGNI